MESYYKYLVEVKHETMEFVYDMIVPYIDNCIKEMFNDSMTIHEKIEQNRRLNRNIERVSVEQIFKQFLEETKTANSEVIEEGYHILKNNSAQPESFDYIIKSAFKSYVLFFTWDPYKGKSRVANNQIFDSLVVKDFIYKCLVETTKYIADRPQLYIDRKLDVETLIRKCINLAMRKSLPLNKILDEYLRLDFVNIEHNKDKSYDDLKNKIETLMAQQQLNNNVQFGKYGNIPSKIINESTTEPFVPENNTTAQDVNAYINHNQQSHNDETNQQTHNDESDQQTHNDNNSETSSDNNSEHTKDDTHKDSGNTRMNEISEIIKATNIPENPENQKDAIQILKEIKPVKPSTIFSKSVINKNIKVNQDTEDKIRVDKLSDKKDKFFDNLVEK